MISNFFIDRPIFATVVSIFITIAGALALISLPIAQYPPVAPPTVQVSVTYPGASAQVVADTIAAPIEQQVNGVENMLYMSSTSDNTGLYNLTITFALNTDLNTALVAVQNRVNLAVPQLPKQVQKQGLVIKKKSPNILLAVNFFSPDGRYDDIYLSNYATIHVKDEIFRLDGVGDITMLGQRDYAIRAWIDPQKLVHLNLGTDDVVSAIQQQNAPLSSGRFGAITFSSNHGNPISNQWAGQACKPRTIWRDRSSVLQFRWPKPEFITKNREAERCWPSGTWRASLRHGCHD